MFPGSRFAPSDRQHKVPSRPKVLPSEVLLPLSIYPRQVDGALAFDESLYL